MKKEYDNPPVFITESGYSDDGRLQDEERILYYVVSYHDFRLDFLIYIYIYIHAHTYIFILLLDTNLCVSTYI